MSFSGENFQLLNKRCEVPILMDSTSSSLKKKNCKSLFFQIINNKFSFSQLRLVATSCFNFLLHAISILNRKISKENAMHCGAFLPWLDKMNLGLAQSACIQVSMVLKTHAFTACINGMCKRAFTLVIPNQTPKKG